MRDHGCKRMAFAALLSATHGVDGMWWCFEKPPFTDSIYTMTVPDGIFDRPLSRVSMMESCQLTASRAEQFLPSGGFAHGRGRLWGGGGPETDGSAVFLPPAFTPGQQQPCWLGHCRVFHGWYGAPWCLALLALRRCELEPWSLRGRSSLQCSASLMPAAPS